MKVYRYESTDGIKQKVEVFDIAECTYSGKDMGERKIDATIKHHSVIDFKVGDFVELDIADLKMSHSVENFYIQTLPTVKKTASAGSVIDSFEHTVTFYPAQYELGTVQMRDIMQENTTSQLIYTGYGDFTFFGGAHRLMERIIYVLNERFRDIEGVGEGNINGISESEAETATGWNYVISEAIDEEKNKTLEQFQFTFSTNSVWDALTKLTEEEGINTDFFINNRIIYVGYKRPHIMQVSEDNVQSQSDIFHFEYGKSSHLKGVTGSTYVEKGGLFDITKTTGTQSPITRLYAYGASQNLNRFYCTDRIKKGRYVNKLMLPQFAADGKTDYIESPRAIEKYGVREGMKIFDEIYPTIRYIDYETLRGIKYCVKIENSGLNGVTGDPTTSLARIQCYRVDKNTTTGVNHLTPAYPDDVLSIFVHATGKTVKCVLYTSQAEQSNADSGNLPEYSNGHVIPGSCYCVHHLYLDGDSNPGTGYHEPTVPVYHCDRRSMWFTNMDNPPEGLSKEQEDEITMHQIQYTDDYWGNEVFLMGYDSNHHPLYDEQTIFLHDGYSFGCYARINEYYGYGANSGSILINELVDVQPVTREDTDMNISDGTAQSYFYIYMRDIGFKINQQAYSGQYNWLVEGEFKVSFLDGYMGGLEFSVSADTTEEINIVPLYLEDGRENPNWFSPNGEIDQMIAQRAKEKGAVWRLRCLRNTDNPYSYMPNKLLNPGGGDHVVFLNIYMPDVYIMAAQNRLLREAQKYLNANDNGDISYSLNFDKIRILQQSMLGMQLREGAIMRIVDDDLKIYTDNDERYLIESTSGFEEKVNLTSTTIVETNNIDNQTRAFQLITAGNLWKIYVDVNKEDANSLTTFNPFTIYRRKDETGSWTEDNMDMYRLTCHSKRLIGDIGTAYYYELQVYAPFDNRDNRVLYKTGYITYTTEQAPADTPVVFRYGLDLLANKHYEVVVDLDESVATDHEVTLYTSLNLDEYYIPEQHSENIDSDRSGFNRYRISFDTPTSFNQDKTYYLGFPYDSTHDAGLHSAYLLSVKESNTSGSGAEAKFVDLTIDQLTIKITDDARSYSIGPAPAPNAGGNGGTSAGKSSSPKKEITAVVKERQKASAWQVMSSQIEETSILSEQTSQSNAQLADIARRNYRSYEMLRDSIFDPDGSVNEVFFRTMMLQTGADSMNFALDRTFIFNGTLRNVTLTKSGSTWSIGIGYDTLRHYVYVDREQGGTWKINALEQTAIDDNICYIALKCSIHTNEGEWIVTSEQKAVDAYEGYYVFNYGIISNAEAGASERFITETRGNVFVYGDNVVLGKISTIDGSSYIDFIRNRFSLGNKMVWDGNTLSLDGSVRISGTSEETSLVSLGGTVGGENIYTNGDIDLSISAVAFSLPVVRLSEISSGIKYISSYGYIQWNGMMQDFNTVLVTSVQGRTPFAIFNESTYTRSHGNIEHIYNWGEIIEENNELNDLYVMFGCTKSELENDTFQPIDININLKMADIMIQIGERLTSYQPPIKHLSESFEDIANASKTDINGGLVLTTMLKLRDSSGNVVSGMSGVENDNVTVWGGGTYAQAVSGNTPVLITRNGYGSRLGEFNVEKDGVYIRNTNSDEVVVFTSDTVEERSSQGGNGATVTLPAMSSTSGTTPRVGMINHASSTMNIGSGVYRIHGSFNLHGYITYTQIPEIGTCYNSINKYKIQVLFGNTVVKELQYNVPGITILSRHTNLWAGRLYNEFTHSYESSPSASVDTQIDMDFTIQSNSTQPVSVRLYIDDISGEDYGGVFKCYHTMNTSTISFDNISKETIIARNGIIIRSGSNSFFTVKTGDDGIEVYANGLPTSDPGEQGKLYMNGNYLCVSRPNG